MLSFCLDIFYFLVCFFKNKERINGIDCRDLCNTAAVKLKVIKMLKTENFHHLLQVSNLYEF